MLTATTVPGFRRLFGYDAWANRHLAAALADAHERPRRLLAHLLTSQLVWLRRLRGEQPTSTTADFWPDLSADACRALVAEAEAALSDFLDGLTEDDLARRATYRNSKGTEYHTPWADVLTHVLLHGSYHRGQAAAALRALGVDPPWTDFIVFAREGG